MAGAKEFIKQIAPYVIKFAPSYHIAVYSPIIAQAVLESSHGTSELAVNATNFFGIKYREGRCPTANGTYVKVGSEQKADGSYESEPMLWCKFPNMEACVQGYFDFTNTPNYANLKGVTDPETYLKNIKADKYASSLDYVSKVMNVIEKYDLTQYDKDVNAMSVPIKTDMANKANYGSKRSMSDLYIVIHYTANDGDSDEANGKYFRNNVTKTSAHYFVDSNSITQTVPDDYTAWAVGGNKYNNDGGRLYGTAQNTNTLNIELCDDCKDGKVYPTDETIKNALYLVGVLMKKYNIPKSRVIRHYDVNGKPCPSYWIDDSKWKKEFWNKIYPVVTQQASASTSYKVRVTVTGLRIRKTPTTSENNVVGYIAPGVYTIVDEKDGWGKLKSGNGWISLQYAKKC